ncbi:hypothetical protein GCM10027059_43060 [Myceligenerans halotolerans]
MSFATGSKDLPPGKSRASRPPDLRVFRHTAVASAWSRRPGGGEVRPDLTPGSSRQSSVTKGTHVHTIDYTLIRALHQERLDHAEDLRRDRRQRQERARRKSRSTLRAPRRTPVR